jgi:hypothetical protein
MEGAAVTYAQGCGARRWPIEQAVVELAAWGSCVRRKTVSFAEAVGAFFFFSGVRCFFPERRRQADGSV